MANNSQQPVQQIQQQSTADSGEQRQTDAAVVDLQRQLQQHSLTTSALEEEKTDWQSQKRTATDTSQKQESTMCSLNQPSTIDLPIANEHHLTNEILPPETLRCILSYCGLRTLVTLRRVSKQLRTLSDGVPKKWINLSDLFSPDMVDLSERIALAVQFAGVELVGFIGFTEGNCDKVDLRALPLLLSLNCPNLKILCLPHLDSSQLKKSENILHDLCKYAASLPKLEEITAVSIPWELVVALPALKRINGIVDRGFGHEVDVEALAWKLSECQQIGGIVTYLIFRLFAHFCENEDILCPEIRGLGGDLFLYSDVVWPYIDWPAPYVVDCVARMFPEVWYSRVYIGYSNLARCLSPIAHRITSANMYFCESHWVLEEEAPVELSNMVCLEELSICGVLAEEYRDFFSFLRKFEQLAHLSFDMQQGCTGLSCLIGMLAPSAPLRKLTIDCEYMPGDFHTHFKALAASGVQLNYLKVQQRRQAKLIKIIFLRPLFRAMPCMERVVLEPCADDVFEFVPRTLANLTYLSVSPLKLSQILALAEERIESDKVVPKLAVQFSDAASVGLAQIERLQLAGIELTREE